MWVIVVQRLAFEFLLDILYFPIWWFSSGARKAGRYLWDLFATANSSLAPGLWLQNLTVPMFGQYDWQGRIISVFMRLVNVIGRGIALFFVLVFIMIVFFIWIVFPVFVLIMLGISLFGIS